MAGRLLIEVGRSRMSRDAHYRRYFLMRFTLPAARLMPISFISRDDDAPCLEDDDLRCHARGKILGDLSFLIAIFTTLSFYCC